MKITTMKEIGEQLGVTSHVVGRKLKEIGLRTHEGKPSKLAFDHNLTDQIFTEDLANYCWGWDADRIIPILEKNAGLKKKEEE